LHTPDQQQATVVRNQEPCGSPFEKIKKRASTLG
jgi:hypothetical protein